MPSYTPPPPPDCNIGMLLGNTVIFASDILKENNHAIWNVSCVHRHKRDVCLTFCGHCTILWFNPFELSIPLTAFLVDKAKLIDFLVYEDTWL